MRDKTYIVRMEKSVAYTASFEVHAQNEDEAREMASDEADSMSDAEWNYDGTLDQSVQSVREVA